MSENSFLVVNPKIFKIVGWANIIFCLFCSAMAWRAGASGASTFFLIFVTLGAYLVLCSGSLQMNLEVILYKTPISRNQIYWGEVERIEVDAQAGCLVFVGEDKRLATIGWAYWSGNDGLAMFKLLQQQVESRNIEVKQTAKAMITLSKNTKVLS